MDYCGSRLLSLIDTELLAKGEVTVKQGTLRPKVEERVQRMNCQGNE